MSSKSTLFPFAEDMLNRYRDERKVMMIGGNNPLGEWKTDGGHFFLANRYHLGLGNMEKPLGNL
ncbi:MAG: hypothetical protein H6602_12905 [Flavobacteriales bacterium]|nr:hypothetical protein [Flavobacteriales bacterium]